MNNLSRKKELMKKELSNLRNEVLSLKQEFVTNRHNVDEYFHSRFHDDLTILNAKERNIHNLILAVLAASASSRESGSRYPSELKPLLRQLNAVEADFQGMLTSLNTKDPLEHADGAIKDYYKQIFLPHSGGIESRLSVEDIMHMKKAKPLTDSPHVEAAVPD
ncbi:hypothetical protein ACTXT7_002275 [Hymenolepis weldensis]